MHTTLHDKLLAIGLGALVCAAMLALWRPGSAVVPEQTGAAGRGWWQVLPVLPPAVCEDLDLSAACTGLHELISPARTAPPREVEL